MSDKIGVVLERFKQLIDDSIVSRQVIADKIGCDVSTITKHYNGERNITVDYVIKYAKYFNVSTDYLLGVSDVKSVDEDVKFICDYTVLNDNVIKNLLRKSSTSVLDILNVLLSDSYYYFFLDFCISLQVLPMSYSVLASAKSELVNEENKIKKDEDLIEECISFSQQVEEDVIIKNYKLEQSLAKIKDKFCEKEIEKNKKYDNEYNYIKTKYAMELMQMKQEREQNGND